MAGAAMAKYPPRRNGFQGPLVLCGKSSPEDDYGDSHHLIRDHDDNWSQAGRIQEAVRNVERLSGGPFLDRRDQEEQKAPQFHKNGRRPGPNDTNTANVSKQNGFPPSVWQHRTIPRENVSVDLSSGARGSLSPEHNRISELPSGVSYLSKARGGISNCNLVDGAGGLTVSEAASIIRNSHSRGSDEAKSEKSSHHGSDEKGPDACFRSSGVPSNGLHPNDKRVYEHTNGYSGGENHCESPPARASRNDRAREGNVAKQVQAVEPAMGKRCTNGSLPVESAPRDHYLEALGGQDNWMRSADVARPRSIDCVETARCSMRESHSSADTEIGDDGDEACSATTAAGNASGIDFNMLVPIPPPIQAGPVLIPAQSGNVLLNSPVCMPCCSALPLEMSTVPGQGVVGILLSPTAAIVNSPAAMACSVPMNAVLPSQVFCTTAPLASPSLVSPPSVSPSLAPPLEMCSYNPLRPRYPSYSELSEQRRSVAKKLHDEIVSFMAENDAAADKSRPQRHLIIQKVREAAKSCWENSSVDVYGSFSTNLFLPHSDIDLVITQQGGNGGAAVRQNLQKLADKLQSTLWCKDVRAIEKTSVPVIKMQADVRVLYETEKRLAVAMGLHARLGSECPLAELKKDMLEMILRQAQSMDSEGAPRADSNRGSISGGITSHCPLGPDSNDSGASPRRRSDSACIECIPVDITFYSSALRKNLQQQHGVVYSPIESRDFVNEQIRRYPAIRPMVLVLKQLLFTHKLNDAYSGGLASHTLILLLVAFFTNVEPLPTASAEAEAVPADCVYGEWLLRTLEWLALFPFETVGIPSGERWQYIALNTVGQYQLQSWAQTGQFYPSEAVREWARNAYGDEWEQQRSELHPPGRIADEPVLDIPHVEDARAPGLNVARSSWRWFQVRRLFQEAHRTLSERCSEERTMNPLDIYLGSPERQEDSLVDADRQEKSILDLLLAAQPAVGTNADGAGPAA